MARSKSAIKAAIRKGQATRARNQAARRYQEYAAGITPEIMSQAMRWYDDAHATAEEIAAILWHRGITNATVELGACILSAFSPREKWASNKRKALAYARGETVKGLGAHTRTADRCVVLHATGGDCFSGLRGRKTQAFARNIAGDHDAVTIDVWMLRAANIRDKHLARKGWYDAISQAVRDLAALFTVPPAAMQAALWIVVRGSDA